MNFEDVKNNKWWWLGGAGGVLALAVGSWYFLFYRPNQIVLENIMKAAEGSSDPITNPTGAKYGDSRDLGVSEIFKPDFWRKNPSKVSIWAGNADGSAGPAVKYADQIYDAGSVFSNIAAWRVNPGADIVAIFKSLRSKEDVSKLADVFVARHGTDLYNYMNDSFMTGGCSPEDDTCHFGLDTNYLKQVYEVVKNQLS